MKNIKNKNGFTLVELIIVVTILAILATIAFISFQSYTAQSRDAKVQSELGNIRNVVEVESSKGVSLVSFVSNTGSSLTGATVATSNLILGGTGIVADNTSIYKAGDINKDLLGTTTTNTYKMGASTALGGVYQLAGTLTADGNIAYVVGNYTKRTNTGSGVGYFNVGDYVNGTATGQITAVSLDKSTYTVGSTGSISATGIRLQASENDGLIKAINATTTTGAVINGSTTNLPYTN